MALVSKAIPNLINGISQQPPEVRLASQGEVQENGLATVVRGLEKRPGTEVVQKLDFTPSGTYLVHPIRRDETEEYTLILGKAGSDKFIKIFDGDGNAMPVQGIGFPIATVDTIAHGGDHTNNSGYTGVALSGGSGSGALATVVVAGNDVTSVTITTVGSNYAVGDSLTIPSSVIGGAANATCVVSTVTTTTPTFTTITDSHLGYFSEITDFSTQVNATTVTDTTFFCSNKKIITKATSNGKTSGQDNSLAKSSKGTALITGNVIREALIYIKQGGFNSKYVVTIKVGGTKYKVGYQTPATLPVMNQQWIGTESIAQILHEGNLAVGDPNPAGWEEFEASTANLLLEGFGGRLPRENFDAVGNADADHWNGFNDVGGMPTNMTMTRNGSILHITHTADFDVSTSDSHGDTDLFAIMGAKYGDTGSSKSTKKFTDLPASGVKDGFITKIAGDNTVGIDDFYVKFEADTLGKGVWRECIGPDEDHHFDYTTMPHRLVRLFDDTSKTTTNPYGITFVFEPVTATADDGRTVDLVAATDYSRIGWNARLAGDDTISPFPSFVGGAITDIFFHKNRLGFLNDENVIFSEAGNYYNYFPLTVISGVDSNPIDVTVSNDKVSLLRHVVPFAESLLFFSELQQFKLSSQGILSPATVSIDVTTQFETDARAKPVSVGRYVFFAFQRGRFSGVREYFVDNRKEVNDAVEVTSHVPQYIPGKITNLVSSSNEQILVCQSSTELQNLYVYKYYWQADDKIQSSWSVWKFGADILNCTFIGSTLQVLISRPDGAYLENINLSTDSSVDIMEDETPVLLDRRVKLAQVVLPLSTIVITDATVIVSSTANLRVGMAVTAGAANPEFSGIPTSATIATITDATHFELSVVATANGSGDITLNFNDVLATHVPYYSTLPSDTVFVNQNAQKIAQADVDTQIAAGDTIYVGIPYNFKYEFTRFLYKQNEIAVQAAKLQLRNINVLYSNTGFFKLNVEVAPYTINIPDPDTPGSTIESTPRKAYEKTFSGFITNSSQIGEYKLLSGSFKSSILSSPQNCRISLTNDEYLPCAFQSAEWEGFLNIRSQRI